MTYSQAYENNTRNANFADSMSQRLPVPGTIPYGSNYYPFPYENTNADYERAGRELKNPLPGDDANIKAGEHFYNIYCAICHGKTGDGLGKILESNKFPTPPSYFKEDIMAKSDGQLYFTIHYGKGMMGSYASQLNQTERWQVVHYINKLQDKKAGG